MKCPKCKTADLRPSKLEDGFSAMGCGDCNGALISMLYYRDWIERSPLDDSDSETGALAEIDDTRTAICCPKCGRLMTRFGISADHDNHIELCASCDESWLDGGEWSLLKSLDLAHKLPSVFGDAWQRRLRKERFEQRRTEKLAQIIDADDLDKAKSARDWLREHPERVAILHYIGSA